MVTNPQHPTPDPRPDPADARFNILIADDDKGNRETLAELLANRGFQTVTAADGSQAVELVQVNMVHLVLFDMHMPGLTGLEAVHVLRQTLGAALPAILMTADATKDLMRQAFLAQVYSVIPKPVNVNIVVHTLTRALTRVYGVPAATPNPSAQPPAPGAGRPTTTNQETE